MASVASQQQTAINEVPSALSNLPMKTLDLFIPPGVIESVSQNLHLSESAAIDRMREVASALFDTYTSGGSRLMWSPVQMEALSVLAMNRCLRRKEFEAASHDIDKYERVIAPLQSRLALLLSERKHAVFREHVVKMVAELGREHARAFCDILRTYASKLSDYKKVAMPSNDTDAELWKMMLAAVQAVPPALEPHIGKRLEIILVEFDMAIKQLKVSSI